VKSSRRWMAVIVTIVMLTPSLLYLSGLPRFGRCQYNDYYAIINLVIDGTRITRDPVRWLRLKSNEHTVTLPALVYVANMALTHGDNRGLSAFALLLLFLTLTALYKLFLPTLDLPPPARWTAGFLVTAYLFSPVPAHSVVMGFSGTIWFLSNLFTVAAIGLFLRGEPGGPAPLAPVLLLGLLGALSYSTNLSLWPALLAAGLVLRRPLRHLAAVGLTGAAVYLVFFHFFKPLPWHPRLETSHPLILASFATTYLGNIFSFHPVRAAVMGSLGVVVAAGSAVWAAASRRPELRHRLAPWIALQVYVLGNSLGTAVGRAGFGIHKALASRYGSLTTLFWIAVLAELLIVLREGHVLPAPGNHQRPATLAAGFVAVVLLIPVFHHGLAIYRAYLGHAARQPLAAEAVRRGIPDMEVLRVLTPQPQQIGWIWGFLKANNQAPFDRPSPQVPPDLPPLETTEAGRKDLKGRLETLTRITGTTWRARGWDVGPGGPAPTVLLIGPDGTALASMVTGLPHAARADLPEDLARHAGWGGYVVIPSPPVTLRAAVLLPGPRLVPLAGALTAAGGKP